MRKFNQKQPELARVSEETQRLSIDSVRRASEDGRPALVRPAYQVDSTAQDRHQPVRCTALDEAALPVTAEESFGCLKEARDSFTLLQKAVEAASLSVEPRRIESERSFRREERRLQPKVAAAATTPGRYVRDAEGPEKHLEECSPRCREHADDSAHHSRGLGPSGLRTREAGSASESPGFGSFTSAASMEDDAGLHTPPRTLIPNLPRTTSAADFVGPRSESFDERAGEADAGRARYFLDAESESEGTKAKAKRYTVRMMERGDTLAERYGQTAGTRVAQASVQLVKMNSFGENSTMRHRAQSLERQLSDKDDKAAKAVSARVQATLDHVPPFFDWSTKLINEDSVGMMRWDVTVTAMLLYTAIITPFEVAFLEPEYNALFSVNRVVDLCFLADTVFQFLLPFRNADGMLVRRHTAIAHHYATGWLAIDIVSITPFEWITIVIKDKLSKNNKQVLRLTRMLRAAKLVRMISRLARLASSSRLFKHLESRISINYAMLGLYMLIGFLALWSHWSACIWGMVINFEGASWSASFYWLQDDTLTVGAQYLACLHWSIGKVTAMGEGDAMLTRTTTQRIVMCMLMVTFGVANAYLIGGVVGILDRMNTRLSEFFSNMDMLNEFLHAKNINEGTVEINGSTVSGRDLCEKLRAFFIFKHSYGGMQRSFLKVLANCSPPMQAAIALKMHSRNLQQVPFLTSASTQFITALSLRLRSQAVAKQEVVFSTASPCSAIYWVELGRVFVRKDIKRKGAHFGEEVFYKASDEPRGYAAIALVESVLLFAPKKDLQEVVEKHGDRLMVRRMRCLGMLLKAFYYAKRAAALAVHELDFHGGMQILLNHYGENTLCTQGTAIIDMWRAYVYYLMDEPDRKTPSASKVFTRHALRTVADTYFEHVERELAERNEEAREQQQVQRKSAVGYWAHARAALAATRREGPTPPHEGPLSPVQGLLEKPELYPDGKGMSQHVQTIVYTHRIDTIARLRMATASDLVAIGVPLGDALDIVAAAADLFNKSPAMSRDTSFGRK